MRNRRIIRNEPQRVAEEEIGESQIWPTPPEWDYSVYSSIDSVVAAIRTGAIPPGKVLEKIREVDRSGNACEWIHYGEKEEYFYMFPQDKIADIFMSDRLPDWWKRKKLDGNGRGVHGDVCASFIPTFFDDAAWREGLHEYEIAFLKQVYHAAPFAAECEWEKVKCDLEKVFALHPHVAQRAHDMFGNNALHYCYAGYMERNGADGYWPGEWNFGAMRLAHFLIERGCDPNEENDFRIAFREIHFGCATEEARFVMRRSARSRSRGC